VQVLEKVDDGERDCDLRADWTIRGHANKPTNWFVKLNDHLGSALAYNLGGVTDEVPGSTGRVELDPVADSKVGECDSAAQRDLSISNCSHDVGQFLVVLTRKDLLDDLV